MVPRPRKQFGQHWLRSDKTLNQILRAAQLSESDRILEIGPGTGSLTRLLLPLVESVIAVEIDRDLYRLLAEKFGQVANFLLLQGDFLSLDLSQALALSRFQKPNKVVANIPYNITGPILETLLGTIAEPPTASFELIVLLLQKEVAERLCAGPGSKVFGALSIRVQYLATCEWICNVPARAFYPPPKVDSAVVRLQPRARDYGPTKAKDPLLLEALIRMGFNTRRKMLRNNLQPLVDRDRLTHLLEQLKIDPQARAEDLSIAQWVALSDQLTVNGEQ